MFEDFSTLLLQRFLAFQLSLLSKTNAILVVGEAAKLTGVDEKVVKTTADIKEKESALTDPKKFLPITTYIYNMTSRCNWRLAASIKAVIPWGEKNG